MFTNIMVDDFKCPDCLLAFASQSSLECHLAIQHSKYLHCLCGQILSPGKEVAEHLVKRHTGVWPFVCFFCNRFFDTKSALQDHLEAHASNVSHVCTECCKSFINVFALAMHQISHSTLAPPPALKYLPKRAKCCLECEVMFLSQRETKSHMKFFHDKSKAPQTGLLQSKKSDCLDCGRHFKSAGQLHTHSLIHLKGFQCQYCGRRYTLRKSLSSHLLTEHSSEFLFKCEVCAQKFEKLHNLVVHWRIHLGYDPFSCKYCEERFGSRTLLKEHMTDKHLNYHNEHLLCLICNKQFSVENRFSSHYISEHTNLKPFRCTLCFQTYNYLWEWNEHMIYHQSWRAPEKPFVLSKVHPFKCNLCKEGFKTRYNLMKHLWLQHSEMESPNELKCPYCSEELETADLLFLHLKTAHQITSPTANEPKNGLAALCPLECGKCGEIFSFEADLKSHLVNHMLLQIEC